MPKAPRSLYNLAFKLKVVAEAEAVVNNSEITGDNVRCWRKDQVNLFNGELKMSAKRWAVTCQKYPELDNNNGLVFRAEKSR